MADYKTFVSKTNYVDMISLLFERGTVMKKDFTCITSSPDYITKSVNELEELGIVKVEIVSKDSSLQYRITLTEKGKRCGELCYQLHKLAENA